eukprot:4608559-Amphidinium_carterae.1
MPEVAPHSLAPASGTESQTAASRADDVNISKTMTMTTCCNDTQHPLPTPEATARAMGVRGLCPCKLRKESKAYVLAIFEGSQGLVSLRSFEGSAAYLLAVFGGGQRLMCSQSLKGSDRGLCPCSL